MLIEAGGDPNPISDIPPFWFESRGSERDWKYTSEKSELSCLGMVDGRCAYPRGKVLGGSSSLNAMLYVRGNKDDYDEWERLGNEGWGYSNVLEYFKKSERSDFVLIEDEDYDSLLEIRQKYRSEKRRLWAESKFASEKYHSNSGMMGVSSYGINPFSLNVKKSIFDAVEELGFLWVPDINGKSQMGFTEAQGTIMNGKRADTAKMFLNPVKDRPNLFVVKHTIAQKIIFKDKKVTGVEFTRKGTDKTVFVKKELILSAGAIDSPKLLMLSGIGPKVIRNSRFTRFERSRRKFARSFAKLRCSDCYK